MLARQIPLQSPSNGERGGRDKLDSTCLTEENRTTHVSHSSVWHLSYALSIVLLDGQTMKCCYLSISDRDEHLYDEQNKRSEKKASLEMP